MLELSLSQRAQGLAERKFSSLELTQACSEQAQNLNQNTNAFISLTPTEALLKAAQIADAQLSTPSATPLTGITLALQDLYCTQGMLTSAASKMLANFVAPYNAAAVDKLNQAGALNLGKTNLAEFNLGANSSTSFYGAVQQGGKEVLGTAAGSALAVQAGVVAASLDVDNGQLRTTAALNGLCALKPTYGRVSRWGMINGAPSLEQAGIMAKTASDCALVLQEVAGHDERDATSSTLSLANYSQTTSLEGLSLGVIKQALPSETTAQNQFQTVIAQIEKLGVKVIEVDLPLMQFESAVHAIISAAETSSNLARFDGVRFGYRCDNPADLEDLYKRSRTEGLGVALQSKILQGTYALSENCYTSFYQKAQQVRRLILQGYQQALTQVDLLLSPTLNNTLGANLTGLPALSLPAANSNFSWQLLGQHFNEAQLLNLAQQYQQATSN